MGEPPPPPCASCTTRDRLLRSAQRQQGLVIYDLLFRHYDSLIARLRP